LTKRLDEVSMWQKDVEVQEQHILDERRARNQLEQKLEAPICYKTGVVFPASAVDAAGFVKESTDLSKAKMCVLEDQVNTYRQKIKGKELVLEELSEKMKLLGETRMACLQDASSKKMETYRKLQGKNKDVTRKLTAAVGELSMQKAIERKLRQSLYQSEGHLAQAGVRLKEGKAPCQEDYHTLQKKIRAFGVEKLEELPQKQKVPENRSMMLQRPTAYVSEQYGVPIPVSTEWTYV
jgi:hypothetical protein